MRLFFAAITLGLLILILSGVGLAWDGSYQLFSILDSQLAEVAYGRWSETLLFAAVVLTSHVTDNTPLLAIEFAALHVVFPLLALAASWWVVRNRAPGLFIWAAFGIGLATLPAQACLVCQSVTVMQLFWPVLLTVLVGVPGRTYLLLAVLVPWMLYFHPAAIPLLSVAAAVAVLVSFRLRERRRALLLTALALGGAVLFGVVRALVWRYSYEASQLTLQQWQTMYRYAVAGLPLQALAFAWLAALLVFLDGFIRRGQILIRFTAFVALAAAVASLVLWASDAHLWKEAVEYRGWSVLLSLPFIALAVLDVGARRWPFRLRLGQLMAIGFLGVLSIQGAIWVDLSNRLRTELASAGPVCIQHTQLAFLRGTVLDKWNIPAYALLVQGRQPSKIVTYYQPCNASYLSQGIVIAKFAPNVWDLRPWEAGWFDKSRLRQALDHDACEFTEGWSLPKLKDSGWQRRFYQSATVLVSASKTETVTLTSQVMSFGGEKKLEVWLNGAWIVQQTIESSTHASPLGPLAVQLAPGTNTLRFMTQSVSEQPDGSNSGIVLMNWGVVDARETALCK
jgi:hypothetical protein